ncbi:hypothetical protein ACFOWZ_09415 [Lentzea rhizosphaerae]|uniref:Uncharacterized protein n=1 Tax=Lentzea rhizosphaerae TaxID=2041025 RepID=A0ABV8BP79_9PSEU
MLKKEGSVATTGVSEGSKNVKYRRTGKSYLTDGEPQELGWLTILHASSL